MQTVKIDRFLRIGIGALLILLVYVIAGSIHEKVIGVGDSAPDFSITTDNGRTISASNFGGRLLVLNFWATWCPPCIQEMPSLDAFQKRFANSGVVVLGISVDKDEKAYRGFLRRANVSFQTARDPENNINADYGTFKYPETYVLDQRRNVLRKFIGPEDWASERMINDIKSLL
jgi:cytochrome c biogenesis protein CcmG/thiol:disulfide interchange protein DsbE